MPRLKENVLGFDIAVDDAAVMGVGQGSGDLTEDAHGVGNGQLALAPQAITERLAAHVGHDVEQEAVTAPGAQHGEDMRVLEMGGERHLALEPRGADFAGELRGQHLHDDVAFERAFGRHKEATHPAGGQLALDVIDVTQDDLEPFLQSVRHCPRMYGRTGGNV